MSRFFFNESAEKLLKKFDNDAIQCIQFSFSAILCFKTYPCQIFCSSVWISLLYVKKWLFLSQVADKCVFNLLQLRKERVTTNNKMMHEDDTEGFIASKAALASSMHHLAGSRFALGDIGNIGAKVSKMTIDDPLKKTSSSNAIKKEILHQQPPVTRQKARKAAAIAAAAHTNAVSTTGSSVINLSTISTKVKASSLKSEIHSDFKV